MENNYIGNLADRVQTRAESVRNTNNDPISKMARGILDLEVWLAQKLKGGDKKTVQNVPSELEISPKGEGEFYAALHRMEQLIIEEYASKMGSFAAPEEIPRPNMCGYTASAVTEHLRKKGVTARTVYGHHVSGERVVYHYWTEAEVSGRKYVVDATYGQFNPDHNGEMMKYPVEDLPNYGLVEYKKGDPTRLEWDARTAERLEDNNGTLFTEEDIDEGRRIIYSTMIDSLSLV